MERRSTIRLGAVLASALLVAFLLWVVLDEDDENPAAPADAALQEGAPTSALSQDGLINLARSLGRPIYWVGPREGLRYELVTTPAGRAFVRYLPEGVRAGDPRPDFLTVATYPMADPLAALRRAGRREGADTIELPGEGLAVTNPATPTSAFYSRPGLRAQVEVYHPSAGAAISLVIAGRVEPIS